MLFTVMINSQIYEVESTPMDDLGSCQISLGGETKSVVIKSIDLNHLHISVDGQAENLFVARIPEGLYIWAKGRTFLAQEAQAAKRRTSSAFTELPKEVTPPTPASVVRILVQIGENVSKGQGLIVVSAMKMEMTLCAPYAGKVRAINTSEGAQVSPGEILVEIDASKEEENNDGA